jgi:hypothetical protein
MYYPILRAKQFELIALREIVSQNPQLFQQFTPILEPVNDTYKPLFRAIEALNSIEVTPLLLINPTVGKFKSDWLDLEELTGLNYLPTIEFNNDTEEVALQKATQLGIEKVAAFVIEGCSVKTLKALNGVDTLIVDTDIVQAGRYQHSLNTKVVLLQDGFRRQDKNAEYSGRSAFSSAIADYSNSKLHGFSDYTITGRFFSEGGGPAYVVAIHLSELSKDESGFGPEVQILINHYVSEDNGSAVDPAGKFMEALSKLIKDVNGRPECFFDSTGLTDFKSLHSQRHFSGLGSAKKNSIKHHIESITQYLIEND